MGTHTCIVSRAGSNASDMSTAVNFAWQVGAGTGANPVNAADFPGGTFPSGTATVAAGAPSATITFQSNPDVTFEPDETGTLTVATTQNGVTIIGSPQPFTITNDDADPGSGGSPAVTYVYGPEEGAGDSNTINIQSTRQQCGRTWRSGAQRWKVVLGQTADGNARGGLQILFKDDTGSLTYTPIADNQNIDANAVSIPYTGAAPSASEPFTYVASDATSIRYYCATTQAGANSRLLATIPYSIWDDATFWGSQIAADRVPSTYAQSNAEAVVANGIYAARLGAVQA